MQARQIPRARRQDDAHPGFAPRDAAGARRARRLVNQTDALEWAAVLRSCSAWDAYRHFHGVDVGPRRVAELLLLSPDFPRSVRFCLAQLDKALRALSGVLCGPLFERGGEALAARLLAELLFSDINDIFDRGLHDYIDYIQLQLNEIGRGLRHLYLPPVPRRLFRPATAAATAAGRAARQASCRRGSAFEIDLGLLSSRRP